MNGRSSSTMWPRPRPWLRLGAGWLVAATVLFPGPAQAVVQAIPTEPLAGGDRLEIAPEVSQPGWIVVWFDEQLLGSGISYQARIRTWDDAARSELAPRVIATLERLSETSWARAEGAVRDLERRGVLSSCERHWIVNGFSCRLTGSPALLAEVPGAARVFAKRAPATPSRGPVGPRYVDAPEAEPFDPRPATAPWSARLLGVDRVWRELGLTGRGVLHVVHDFGWKLDVPPLAATLYRNPGEIPGNDLDDDGNGHVDDVHGYDFDRDGPDLNHPRVNRRGGIHGNLTAAIIAGRRVTDGELVTGLSPDARWAAVQASSRLEAAVEWALEQGADTYSMSFSLPGLGESRSHWRKVFEHAALAGLFAVSGAGNFADPSNANFAPVPVQMRTPEDIPVVFGVAGVDSLGSRPSFSSQGPVRWSTEHYREGEVLKPDFATVNSDVVGVDLEGRASGPWRGNSFAGPHLAGVLALMLEADPDLTPWRARRILRETARDLGAEGHDPQHGHGLIDARAAVGRVLRHRTER